MALLDHPGLRGVSGVARLRRVLAGLLDDQPVPDSILERRFADLLDRHALDGFERQVRPPWYDGRRGVVDFADRAAGLIVEVDGRQWHATTQAMADDRRRDRQAAVRGWQVVRLMWADIVDGPEQTAEHLRPPSGPPADARSAFWPREPQETTLHGARSEERATLTGPGLGRGRWPGFGRRSRRPAP